jgi:hydrogenase maturation factor
MNPIDSLQQRIDTAVTQAVAQIKDNDNSDVTHGNVTRQVTLGMTVGASALCDDDFKVDLGGVDPDAAVRMIEVTVGRAVEAERKTS